MKDNGCLEWESLLGNESLSVCEEVWGAWSKVYLLCIGGGIIGDMEY
jgi:hypothetical protein